MRSVLSSTTVYFWLKENFNLLLSFPSHHLQTKAENMDANQMHQVEIRWKEKLLVAVANWDPEQIISRQARCESDTQIMEWSSSGQKAHSTDIRADGPNFWQHRALKLEKPWYFVWLPSKDILPFLSVCGPERWHDTQRTEKITKGKKHFLWVFLTEKEK